MSQPADSLQMVSTVRDGQLTLALKRVPLRTPKDDEVVVRVEAAPINPSDLAVVIGPADSENFTANDGDLPSASGPIPPHALRVVAGREGKDIPIGNEGAGTVVATGGSPEAQALVGKTVSLVGGAMYAEFRVAKARDCMVLTDGTSAEEGASSFVNPMTALGFIGTMRLDGYKGLIHTAAASNLGQMLVKLCASEGIPLVNIVRSDEQAALLKGLGAEHVLNSKSETFMPDLIEAIAATKAYLAFDAIGGGRLANQILIAMEQAALRSTTTVGNYGSTQMKQVYLFGRLDPAPTELTYGYGMKWGVGGWLVSYHLERIGIAETIKLRHKVAAEIKTIFASAYTRRITLAEAVSPDVIAAYNRKSTGEKYLIVPHASA